jgi:tetratricopeptide (TPR) repeat protein
MLKSNIKWVYLMVILFILSFIFLPQNKFGAPSTIKRITEITEYKKNVYPPIHQRLMIWSCGWEMVQKNPILGQGWGLFELYYPYYQGKYLFDNIYRNLRTHANNAHNELLEVWSQTGTIGLTLYLWFLVTGFVYGIKLTNSLSNDKKIFSLSILAGVIGMFIDNIFGNVSLQFCVPAFLYWWNIGMLTSLDTSRKIYEFRISGIIKLLFSIIILSLCLLVYRAYNQFMGEINYFKGFKYSKRNDLINSIRYLERAHRYYREVNSEYELGNCYARTGQKDKAEWAYYQALAANCGYDEIFFNLATVYSQKGEKENAILNYTQALYINPISQESYLALSNIFFSDIPKYQTEAIELLKQATKLFPNNPDFWNNLGYLYTTTGNNNLAIEIYRKAFELNPESEQIKHNLETALKKIGKTDDDVFKYDILIKTIEQKINSKDWAEVLVLSKKLVTIAPNSYRARFYLANAYFTTGDIDNAINEYKEAVRISPNNIYAHSNLAIAYLQKGFTELAKEELLKILQIDPQNKFAKEKLESLLK